MKKTLIIFIALSMLFMCMTACTNSNPSGANPSESQTVYELLDELADKDYSNIEIDIVTTTDFVELNSYYVLSKNKVTYSVEKLNILSTDETPTKSSYKTEVSGSASIRKGQIVSFDGSQDITLPSYDELKGNFNFSKSNFKNVIAGKNYFEADVVSPSTFYGASVSVKNLKVKVEYTESSLTAMTVSYNTENASVQTVYTFED